VNPDVTAVLVNYRRQANMPRLVAALKAQSIPVDVIVVNNGAAAFKTVAMEVEYTWNAGPFARFLAAVYADTPWVAFFDDDICPADGDFLRDALRIADSRPEAVTGAYGRRLEWKPPHYREDATGEVELVKGRFMLFRRDVLERVRLTRAWFEPYRLHCDDLYLCMEIGRGQPVHWADAGLAARLEDLPAGDVGLEKQPDHYKLREEFCARYLKEVLR
jgi:GT2 family glycosyltransferase